MQDTAIPDLDRLPDAALLSVPQVAALLGQGQSTTWRRMKNDASFPRPVRLGTRATRIEAGQLKRWLILKKAGV